MRMPTVLLAGLVAVATGSAAAQFAGAWDEYAADPDRHPNIPNVSHAG